MKAAEVPLIINRRLIQLKVASILDDVLMDDKNPVEQFHNGLSILFYWTLLLENTLGTFHYC